MEYTINEVFDIKEEQIYQANEFLSKSEHELMHWRRALEESILMGKPRLICPYCHQMLKLCGRKCQRGVVSYFSHLYDSEDCPIKTTTQLTKEEIEIRKYGKVNESKRHQELKHLIADVLQDEKSREMGIDGVQIEKRIDSQLPYMNWRRPDVQAQYKGMNIVFELQLSTTFLSVVVDRDIFYRLNGYFIVWVFNFDDNKEYVNLHNMMCKDIYYANKRNVFILDKKAQELSRERGELVLCCQWLDADGSFSEAEYISLEQLKYDTENFKPYYVDADEIYYKANPAVKLRLEELERSRAELLQGLMDRKQRELELQQAECVRIERIKQEIIEKQERASVYEKNGAWGFMYHSQTLTAPIYSDVEWNMHLGMFDVKKARRWGLANRAGGIVIPCVCSFIKHLADDIYLIASKKEWRIWGSSSILKTVSTTDEYQLENIRWGFYLLTFHFKKRGGYNRQCMKFLVFPNRQTVEIEQVDIAAGTITIKGRAYMLHQDGYIYSKMDSEVNLVMQGDKLLGLHKSGVEMLAPQYSEIEYISEDCILVRREGGMGVMTLQGKTIVPLAFDNVIPADYGFYKTQSTEERFAYANYISKCIVFGLFDNEGHEVLTPQFDSIVPISTDYIITRKEQRYNLYNLHDTAPLLSGYKYLEAGAKGELIAASKEPYRDEYKCIIDYSGNIILGEEHQFKTIYHFNGTYVCCEHLQQEIIAHKWVENWTLIKEGKMLPMKIKANNIDAVFDNFIIASPYGYGMQCLTYDNRPLTPVLYQMRKTRAENYPVEFELDGKVGCVDAEGLLHYEGGTTVDSKSITEECALMDNLFVGLYAYKSNTNQLKGVYRKTSVGSIDVVVPFEFHEIHAEGKYIICEKKKQISVTKGLSYFALYDTEGRALIPLFWNATSINIRQDGIIELFLEQERYDYWNRHHVWLNPDFSLFLPWFNDVSEIGIFSEDGVAEAKEYNRSGKVDINGNRVKEVAEVYANGVKKTSCFSLYGIDAADGTEIISCKYGSLERLPNGVFIGNGHDIISAEGAFIKTVKGEVSYFNDYLLLSKDEHCLDNENKILLYDLSGKEKTDHLSAAYEKDGYVIAERMKEYGRGWNTQTVTLQGLYTPDGECLLYPKFNYMDMVFENIVLCRNKGESYCTNILSKKTYNATNTSKVTQLEDEVYYCLHSYNDRLLVDGSFRKIGTFIHIHYDVENGIIEGKTKEGKILNALTGEVLQDSQKIEIGGIYDGVITNIKPFGLFVKFLSDHIGLVHKSVLKKKGVQIYDFKPKQRIQVKVKDIKDDGKINLEVI